MLQWRRWRFNNWKWLTGENDRSQGLPGAQSAIRIMSHTVHSIRMDRSLCSLTSLLSSTGTRSAVDKVILGRLVATAPHIG